MKIFAIIPAGGRGSRSGQNTPKQYVKFNNKELIAYTLEIFQRNKLNTWTYEARLFFYIMFSLVVIGFIGSLFFTLIFNN